MKSTELKKDIILWKDLQKLYNKQQKDAVKNWIDEICNEVSDWKKTIKTEIEEMKNGNSRIDGESSSIENLLGNADGEHDEVKADSSSGRKRRSGV
jgi:hypothetical protein